MTTHQVNLEYLAEAANLLMGPQGALRLSVVYTTIENVAKRAHASAADTVREGAYNEGWADGWSAGLAEAEAEEITEAYRVADELSAQQERKNDAIVDRWERALLTLNEVAHGDDHDVADINLHKTHYDIWNGRFHRPGAAE